MALQLYHDSGGTNLIESGDEDIYRNAVSSSNTAVDEKIIYVGSDDTNLTYENITIDAINDEDSASVSGEIDVTYAVDNSGTAGTYQDVLTLSDGDFSTPVPVWRKVTAPNVTSAFKRTDIQHELNFDEYVK